MAVAFFDRFLSLSCGAVFRFLLELSDAWYPNQTDVIAVLRDVRRAASYSAADERVRELVFCPDEWQWRAMTRAVREDMNARNRHLRSVRDMLVTMGLTEKQAKTMLQVLCTNEDISDELRAELVSLYTDSVILEPFADTPLRGTEEALDAALKEKNVLFLIRILDCLPVSGRDATARLESSLSRTLLSVREGKVRAGLMRASGVSPVSTQLCADDGRITTSRVTAPVRGAPSPAARATAVPAI